MGANQHEPNVMSSAENDLPNHTLDFVVCVTLTFRIQGTRSISLFFLPRFFLS